MHDTLRLNSPALDIKAWTMINYMRDNRLGRLDIFLRWDDNWVAFDSQHNDCEDYLTIVLDTVNRQLEGE
jgi:hypothetical protein